MDIGTLNEAYTGSEALKMMKVGIKNQLFGNCSGKLDSCLVSDELKFKFDTLL